MDLKGLQLQTRRKSGDFSDNMFTDEELTDVLALLADYSRQIGDEVLVENEPGIVSTEEGAELRGNRLAHGEHIYLCAGHEEREYFSILFFASLTQNIANSLSEDVAAEIVESRNEEAVENVNMQAVNILLSEIPEATMTNLNANLFLVTSSGLYGTNFDVSQSGTLRGFHIEKKIFPNTNSFDVSRYNEAVQAVVSGGTRASTYLSQSIHLDIDADNPGDSEIEISA